MKKRLLLIPITLMLLIFLLVSGLSAGDTAVTLDTFVYLPMVLDTTDLLFSDDFSDENSGWPVDDDGDTRWSYQNGEYEILIRDSNIWAGALAPVDGLKAYNIRATMRRLQGSSSDYGLVFDWKDWDNFYYLVMDPSGGWFGVAKFVNGTPKIVVPRTDASNIQPGNAKNRLRIDRNGQELVVSINGKRLATAQDREFAGDVQVGLYMESDDVAPAVIRYDDFEVWRLDNNTAQGANEQQIDLGPARDTENISAFIWNDSDLFD